MAEKEFKHDDPLSLNGMVLDLPPEEAKRAEADMAACFIEEYLRIGYSAEKILSLFKDPFYQGTHSVYQSRGENYVRGLIREVCGDRSRKQAGEAGASVGEDAVLERSERDGDKEALPNG